MNQLLNQYKVNFYKKKISVLTLYFMTSVSDVLSGFISDWQNIEDVIAAIQTIDKVVSGEINRIDYLSDMLITIEVDLNGVKLFADPDLNSNVPDFSLPIQDFRGIVDAWKVFLLSSK